MELLDLLARADFTPGAVVILLAHFDVAADSYLICLAFLELFDGLNVLCGCGVLPLL